MQKRAILLVEDNLSDVGLTKQAVEKQRIHNELVVVGDGRMRLP